MKAGEKALHDRPSMIVGREVNLVRDDRSSPEGTPPGTLASSITDVRRRGAIGSANLARLLVENHELSGGDCEQSVRSALVVAELHFVHFGRKKLDDRAHLPSAQSSLGYIFRQGHDIEKLYPVTHRCASSRRT
jgi:hypothetical protein